MPALRDYHLFISHAWQYSDDYQKLLALLKAAPLFVCSDYSVPKRDPLDARTARQLWDAICQQIAPTSVVLVLSGMYTAYSKWMQAEIDIAQLYRKPIVGIVPRGNEVAPRAVTSVAAEMVGWSTLSIVGAIRRRAL